VGELERWNDRYAAPGYLFGEGPNAYLAAQAGRLPARGSALCVADGDGRNSVWLAERGLEVTAFDFSPVAVAKARELAARRGVKVAFDVADVAGWRWPAAAYDVVAAIFVQFADPALRAVMFGRMVRALKPGGLLIVQGYTPKQLDYKTGGPSQVENLYTPQLLRDSFSGLEMVELSDYEAELTEGDRHVGRSALIGMVARKPAV
jgi:SAM-dependent methyltransferase